MSGRAARRAPAIRHAVVTRLPAERLLVQGSRTVSAWSRWMPLILFQTKPVRPLSRELFTCTAWQVFCRRAGRDAGCRRIPGRGSLRGPERAGEELAVVFLINWSA